MSAINLMDDEIIVALRAQKEAFAASAGFDIRRLAEQIRQGEAQSVQQGWALVQPCASLGLLARSAAGVKSRAAYADIRFAQ